MKHLPRKDGDVLGGKDGTWMVAEAGIVDVVFMKNCNG